MSSGFKSFTDGIAIFLVVLIAIYLLTGIIKADNPKGEPLTLKDKVMKVFDTAAYRSYISIMLLLIFSAATGIILRRLPWLAVLNASLTLTFELYLLTCRMLPKYPTGVILFTAAHLGGAVAYAAYCDRKGSTRLACAASGGVVGLFGAGFAAYVAVLAGRVASCADTSAALQKYGLTLSDAVRPIRGAVDRIYSVLHSEGGSAARLLSEDYTNSLGRAGVGPTFYASVEGGQLGTYMGVCIMFFGVAVLAFAISGMGYRRLSFALSCVPVAVVSVMLANEKLSAGGIVLLAAAVISLVCFAAAEVTQTHPEETEKTVSAQPQTSADDCGDRGYYAKSSPPR